MLERIEKFCPKGMQIKSPHGLSFDPAGVVAVEVTDGGRDGSLKLHYGSSCTVITFHGNHSGGGPQDIYGLAHNIREACNKLKS